MCEKPTGCQETQGLRDTRQKTSVCETPAGDHREGSGTPDWLSGTRASVAGSVPGPWIGGRYAGRPSWGARAWCSRANQFRQWIVARASTSAVNWASDFMSRSRAFTSAT